MSSVASERRAACRTSVVNCAPLGGLLRSHGSGLVLPRPFRLHGGDPARGEREHEEHDGAGQDDHEACG